MNEIENMMVALAQTYYHQWMAGEGIPIIKAHALEDVRDIKLAPWSRNGGNAAFVHLYGMEGVTGMYVAEIPPGGALEPERHLYEEVICIVDGQGATEVWQEGEKKQMFEWGQWSLFAPPLNAWHRLINGGREPARFIAVTSAPLMMDMLRNASFVFDCPQSFSERFAGEQSYFNMSANRYKKGLENLWETNFISNVCEAPLESKGVKGTGFQSTQFEIAANSLIGHIAVWPAGVYHKAHYHGPGALLLGLQSSGYVLLWPKEAGVQPFESGNGDRVVEVQWKGGSVYCPPGGWFHQHFNTGPDPARQIAVRFGTSRLHPVGFQVAAKRMEDGELISVKKGGTMIEYEEEDPEIRRRYEAALKKKGLVSKMAAAAAG